MKLDTEFPVARPRYEFWPAFETQNLKIFHYFLKIDYFDKINCILY